MHYQLSLEAELAAFECIVKADGRQSDKFHYLAAFQHILVPTASLRGCDPPKLTLGHNSSYPKLDVNSGIAFTRPLLNAESPDMEYSKQTNKQKTTAKKITEVPVL